MGPCIPAMQLPVSTGEPCSFPKNSPLTQNTREDRNVGSSKGQPRFPTEAPESRKMVTSPLKLPSGEPCAQRTEPCLEDAAPCCYPGGTNFCHCDRLQSASCALRQGGGSGDETAMGNRAYASTQKRNVHWTDPNDTFIGPWDPRAHWTCLARHQSNPALLAKSR